MKWGLYLPSQGEFADARLLAELANEAERTGWEGVFIWDEIVPVFPDWHESADAWILLTAIAMRTERIRFGAMVTPLARRRPAKLALEAVTLDRLSNGRLVLGVGLGNPDTQFTALGEDGDARVRARKVDEFLELLARLWSGESVTFRGAYYTADNVVLLPTPVQTPRIPIWIGADSRNRAPLRRVARWDGYFPASPNWPDQVVTPEEYRTALSYVHERRTGEGPFDVVLMTDWTGEKPVVTPGVVAEYAESGVTWWLVQCGSVADARRRILAGPPQT